MFEQQCLHDTAAPGGERCRQPTANPRINHRHLALRIQQFRICRYGAAGVTHGRRHSPAENMPAMPAVVLAHDDGEIGVTALAPEDGLVFDPPRPLFALLRLLELLERPAQRGPAVSERRMSAGAHRRAPQWRATVPRNPATLLRLLACTVPRRARAACPSAPSLTPTPPAAAECRTPSATLRAHDSPHGAQSRARRARLAPSDGRGLTVCRG